MNKTLFVSRSPGLAMSVKSSASIRNDFLAEVDPALFENVQIILENLDRTYKQQGYFTENPAFIKTTSRPSTTSNTTL